MSSDGTDGTDSALVRELFATPPPDFVATRNEMAKALRRDKRRDDAAALGALRRPGWDEWALNSVAVSDPDAVAAFADAAGAVREAQTAAIEGRDGPDVRDAIRDLRERSAELVRLAETAMSAAGRTPVTGEVNARLSQAAGSDVAVAQLRAGVLGAGDAPPSELFGDVTLAPAAPAGRSQRRTPTPAQPTTSDDPAAARAARAERERRKAALADANRLHAAAVKARHRADVDLDKAEAAAARARAALEEAELALAEARERADEAAADVERAETDVDAARAAVEEHPDG